MRLLDKVYSKIDRTVKYIFQLDDGLISETSYIDKNDGKDIICVGTHTGCHLGCRFCHTTDCSEVKVRPFSSDEIFEQVQYVHADIKGIEPKMLLVSFMGCGEPMHNPFLISSMVALKKHIQPIRFAVATLIPESNWREFFNFTYNVKFYGLAVKVHLSLHFVDDETRQGWMPAALRIEPSIAALEFYQKLTGNSVEVHYTLVDDVNDSIEDAAILWELLQGRNIPVKLLQYNERETIENKASGFYEQFYDILCNHVNVEYYDPPGKDVGASCGQFLLDYYRKYNT